MNMTIVQYGSRYGWRWSQFKRQVAEWRHRAYSRYELQTLSDRTLRDIGLTRCETHREASKPFWMA